MTGGTIDLVRRWTIGELDELPEDGRRDELADGVLLVSPAARRRHPWGATVLADVLRAACPPERAVFGLPIDVDDPDATHLEPDPSAVRRDMVLVDDGDLPLLVVEVRSPPTAGRDALPERRECARLGVPSSWLLDVDRPSLRVLELQAGEHVEVA